MIAPREWTRGEYTISTDPSKLDLDAVHRFLARSYWAQGIPREIVARSIAGSISFGMYLRTGQIGFARVISDCATFAYVADVFVLENHRGRGLARWMMECILEMPELQGLRRWLLITRDAHSLYRNVGFSAAGRPEGFMEIKGAPYHQSDK